MIKIYGGSESISATFAGSSTSVDYYFNYTDINANSVVDSGTGQGNSAAPQTTTIVPGPATNAYTRQVNYLSFTNNDVSNTSSITISKVNISSTVTLATTTLQPGWSLRYQDNVGWQVFDQNNVIIPYPTITLTGDVTGSGTTSIPTTLATVNPDVGTFGDATHVPQITVNGKGLVTAVTDVVIPFPTPGGTNGQVQYNNSGAFGGTDFFEYNPTNKKMTVGSATNTTPTFSVDSAVNQLRFYGAFPANPANVANGFGGIDFISGAYGFSTTEAGFGSEFNPGAGRVRSSPAQIRGGTLTFAGGNAFDGVASSGKSTLGGQVLISAGTGLNFDGTASAGAIIFSAGTAIISGPTAWTLVGGSGYTDGVYNDQGGLTFYEFSDGSGSVVDCAQITISGGQVVSFTPGTNIYPGATVSAVCPLTITDPNYVGGGSGASITITNVANSSGGTISFNAANGSNSLEFELNGEWSVGSSSIGTSGQVITSNGAGSAPSWANGVAPGGTNGELQFNNSGVFGGTLPVYSADIINNVSITTPANVPTILFQPTQNATFSSQGTTPALAFSGASVQPNSSVLYGGAYVEVYGPGGPWDGPPPFNSFAGGNGYINGGISMDFTGGNTQGGDITITGGAGLGGASLNGDVNLTALNGSINAITSYTITGGSGYTDGVYVDASGQGWYSFAGGSGGIFSPQIITISGGSVVSVGITSQNFYGALGQNSTIGDVKALTIFDPSYPGGGSGASITVNSVGNSTSGSVKFQALPNGVVRTKFNADGSWEYGATPGTLGQALVSQGAGTSPLWETITATAGGSNGQIQWNNAGTLDGLPTSNWDGTNLTFTGANEATTNGGNIILAGGQNASGANGGNASLLAGIGDVSNGYVLISAAGGASPSPKDVYILSGNTLTLFTTSTMVANIGGSAGTTGQVLGSDGAGNVTWQGTPLTATYVGYGSAGNTLTGTPDFTWTDGTCTLQIGTTIVGSATIITPNGVSNVNGANLDLLSGNGGSGSGTGGEINVTAGNAPGSGNGGIIQFTAGNAAGAGSGGGVGFVAGSGSTNGQIEFDTNAGSTPLAIFGVGGLDVCGFTADVKLQNAGNGIYIKEGSNATMGLATLVGGTVTVNTTKVTANSRIFLTAQDISGVAIFSAYGISARAPGTSFTITASSALDTSDIAWQIIEPA